jgi:hypothetical protein
MVAVATVACQQSPTGSEDHATSGSTALHGYEHSARRDLGVVQAGECSSANPGGARCSALVVAAPEAVVEIDDNRLHKRD